MRSDDTRSRKKSLLIPLIALLLSVFLLLTAWWVANRSTPRPGLGTQDTQRLSEEEIQGFFDSEVSPRLEQYSERNRLAVNRAVERINAHIVGYRKEIPSFVDDVTSWGMRFGVIGRASGDLWTKWWGEKENATRVHDYVSGKFEKHLFSEQDLEQLITSALNQFRDDMKANQNMLHVEIRTAWDSKGYTGNCLDLTKISSEVNQNVTAVCENMATDSLIVGVLTFVGGFVFEEATAAAVKVIIARVSAYLATSAAVSAVSSGGATVSGAAAGGAVGSTGGPVGTVIGVGAGLVVGFMADWWMSKKFEQKLTAECNDLISRVRDQVLVGTAASPGLKVAFTETILSMQKAEKAALHEALAEVAR